jgi:hypothetical protein
MARPLAPSVDMLPQRGEHFDLRVGGHALFLTVTAQLTAYDILGSQRPHRTNDPHFFVAPRLGIGIRLKAAGLFEVRA